jgi:adenylate cyclase
VIPVTRSAIRLFPAGKRGYWTTRVPHGNERVMNRLHEIIRREPRRGLSIPPWLDRLFSIGIQSSDPQVVQRQRCVNIACYTGAVSGASYFLMTSLYDFRGLLPLNAHNVLLILAGGLLPFCHRFGEHFVAILFCFLLGLGQLYVVWMLGITADLHTFFLLAGAGLYLFGIQNWKLFLGLFAYALTLLLVALNFAPVDGILLPTDGYLRDMVSSQTLISVMVINAALTFYALALVNRAEMDLEQEHERSEALIATVMPASIAARLKRGEERIADRIETLSVLFADLVSFTSAAHDLPPEEIVGFLDRLVRRLDALAEQHGVEKIKTIGDAYMAAAGFDGRTRESAIAIGRFALALIDVIAQQPPLGTRKLALRIGIHTGPATAGVIGDTRFSYDVWGDAVNVASRMESHGLPRRIQVSEAFRDLTQDAFVFEEREVLTIKGIGEARTYFLTGETAR